MVKCLGCSSNDECNGPNERCDLADHICRPQCTTNEDCQGDKLKCDTSKRLCVTGKM